MEYTVAELYREIGKVFREHGAQRVALLSSRTNQGTVQEMTLELAVDGDIVAKELYQECHRRWPSVEMVIYDLNDENNVDLIDEVVEDSILL